MSTVIKHISRNIRNNNTVKGVDSVHEKENLLYKYWIAVYGHFSIWYIQINER